MRVVSGLPGRVVDALQSGDVELIQILFDCDFLKATDTFDLTGSNRHDTSDAVSMMHVLARRPCPDYKYMIDILLFNEVRIDDGMPLTPLEEAIQSKNFPTAAYLESKGATYCLEEVASFLNEYEAFKAKLAESTM
jgi:hypothetical protein